MQTEIYRHTHSQHTQHIHTHTYTYTHTHTHSYRHTHTHTQIIVLSKFSFESNHQIRTVCNLQYSIQFYKCRKQKLKIRIGRYTKSFAYKLDNNKRLRSML